MRKALIFKSGITGLLFASVMLAQSPYGRIIGRVTDASGAVVPGASAECVNLGTNVVTSTKSNSEGNFELPNLIPGQYRLVVSMTGFKKYERGPMELRVGDALSLPVSLELGTQAESVTVSTEAPLLESANATTGQVLDSKRIAELPVPASNPLFMTLLTSNITLTTSPFSTFTPDGKGLVARQVAAGTLAGQTMQSFDGMPSMQSNHVPYIVPPPEILQEVKISTTSYDASQGRFTGAQINMVTKSGTNELHGAVAVWNQNTSLNALDFFTKKAINDPKTGPVTHEKIRSLVPYINWFRSRGTVGGPVYIPKLYNGKNRTFFQYGFDHFYMPYSTAGYRTVPTPDERNGDFSALLGIGPQYQLYDPYSATATPGGHVTRTPLAGNLIPQGQVSPVAKKLLQYWPAPNATGTVDGRNNYYGGPNSSIDYTASFVRIDQVVRDNQRLFVSYNRYCLYALQDINFGKPLGDVYPTGLIQDNCHQGATVDYVITPSPSWVVDVRYGLARFRTWAPSTTNGFNTNTLGMSPKLMQGVDPSLTTIPALTIDNITGIGGASGTRAGELFNTLFASATHMRGNHTIRFGIDVRTMALNNNTLGNITPAYTFSSNWLKGTDTSAASPMGQGLASFVYGLPTGGSIDRNDSTSTMSKMFAWYVQDDWKVTRRLTLNLGFRQELEFPITERYNRANRGFDFAVASPVQTAAQANFVANAAAGKYSQTLLAQLPTFNVLGGQQFASNNNRSLTSLYPHNFMPRIGLTYQLASNTVVRAGYGIYFESLAADFVSIYQNGYSQSTSIVPSMDNGLSFQVNMQNYPFPNGILTPAGASGGLNTFLGRSITFSNPEKRAGYAQRWNFNIQQQFGQRVLVEVGYMGNRGTRLGTYNAWNSLPLQYLSRSPVRDPATISALSASVANPFYGIPQFTATGLANPTVSVSQLLMPYPEFTGLASIDGSGFSWYHSLSVRVERRFSQGFTIQGNYTWSKFMEADSRLNGIQDSLTHTISASDRPQQFSANGIYELPIGKGRRWVNSIPGWADRIIGGWQAEAIYIAQSGSPMAFGNILFNGDLHNIPLAKSDRTIQRYFNTDAGFNTIASQQLASNYRTFPLYLTGARNPGYNLWNLSLLKNIRLRERTSLELRGEAKGALNHPNWGGPNLTPTSTLFGQITSVNSGRMITLQAKVMW